MKSSATGFFGMIVARTRSVPDSVPDENTYVRREVVAEPSAEVVDLIDVAVHDSYTYGYVSGVGDDVPRVLSGLGLSVELLSDDALSQSDLGRYDVIAIGPNAFLSRDGLVPLIRRKGVLRVICENPRHKQRQG